MKYKVTFTLGGCVVMGATLTPYAMDVVEGIIDKKLLILSNVSLEIQSVKEVME